MKTLINKSQSILNQNWRNGYTVPTSKLYPFQWNWDSGFVSLGLAHFNAERARKELKSLFSGQWQNGMLPHIIFHSEKEKTYFPNFEFWNSNINPGAPVRPKTSGITQPPVHGFILKELLDRYPDSQEMKDFAKELFPKIVNSHRFFYDYRDPKKEGLFFIFHPWESGRDNSPLWDEALDLIHINKEEIGDYTRRDTSIADASERPTSAQYDRYVYLLQLGKKHQYDQPGLVEESPFLIQDSMMNAILIRSNQCLIEIGGDLGFDTAEISEWQTQSVRSFNEKLWSEELSFYVGYDLRNEKIIAHKEIGGLVPLYSQIPNQDRAKKLNDYLMTLHNRGYHLCPSFDVDSPLFDSKRYWRGPIWPQMNWMIHHGLKAYGFNETAQIVKEDLIHLVEELGFFEYFESEKSKIATLRSGYGGDNFSWTASTIIDLLTEA